MVQCLNDHHEAILTHILLIQKLSSATKEILNYAATSNNHLSHRTHASVYRLVQAIENLLFHGLRRSSDTNGGSHFWDLVESLEAEWPAAFAPSIILTRMNSKVNTSRGLCRSWIRLLLNQDALEFNLQAFKKSTAKDSSNVINDPCYPFYSDDAFLRSALCFHIDNKYIDAPLKMFYSVLELLNGVGFNLNLSNENLDFLEYPMIDRLVDQNLIDFSIQRSIFYGTYKLNKRLHPDSNNVVDDDNELESLFHRHIEQLNSEYASNNIYHATMSQSAVLVSNCFIPIINGRYVCVGILDDVPYYYLHGDVVNGSAFHHYRQYNKPFRIGMNFEIFRKTNHNEALNTVHRYWYIADADTHQALFYTAVDEANTAAPTEGWKLCDSVRVHDLLSSNFNAIGNQAASMPELYHLPFGGVGVAAAVLSTHPEHTSTVIQDELKVLDEEIARLTNARKLLSLMRSAPPAAPNKPRHMFLTNERSSKGLGGRRASLVNVNGEVKLPANAASRPPPAKLRFGRRFHSDALRNSPAKPKPKPLIDVTKSLLPSQVKNLRRFNSSNSSIYSPSVFKTPLSSAASSPTSSSAKLKGKAMRRISSKGSLKDGLLTPSTSPLQQRSPSATRFEVGILPFQEEEEDQEPHSNDSPDKQQQQKKSSPIQQPQKENLHGHSNRHGRLCDSGDKQPASSGTQLDVDDLPRDVEELIRIYSALPDMAHHHAKLVAQLIFDLSQYVVGPLLNPRSSSFPHEPSGARFSFSEEHEHHVPVRSYSMSELPTESATSSDPCDTRLYVPERDDSVKVPDNVAQILSAQVVGQYIYNSPQPHVRYVIRVTVRQPYSIQLAAGSGDGAAATAQQQAKTRASVKSYTVQRRYKAFKQLHAHLQVALPGIVLPAMPASSWRRSFNEDYISSKRVALNDFLQDLLRVEPENTRSGYPIAAHPMVVSFLSQIAPGTEGQVGVDCVSETTEEQFCVRGGGRIGRRIPANDTGLHISLVLEERPDTEAMERNSSGLAYQDFKCASCACDISIAMRSGLNWSSRGETSARFCHYTERWFCATCFGVTQLLDGFSDMFDQAEADQRRILPTRVLHHWDFSKYPVSAIAAEFLDSTQEHPVICVSAISPALFSRVKALQHSRLLRLQLNFTREFIETCPRCNNKAEGGGILAATLSEEYLHLATSTELFSMADLINLCEGSLVPFLMTAVERLARHITTECKLCMQHGFICEVCENPNPIYPFQIVDAVNCRNCKAYFHRKCFSSIGGDDSCPRCIRDSNRKQLS